MPSEVLIRLLLWAVALNAGLLLLLMWRRGLGGRYGYAALLGVEVLASAYLLYTRKSGHPLAVVVIGAFLFMVVVPGLLRVVTGWAVQRGRFGLASRLTSLREMLQPGAGVGREKELLQVIQQVQSGDTDEILDQLEQRAVAETDPQLQALLHEQCLTLMVVERRWDQSLAYATEHITPHLVANRPRLGAALIRVYGEVGDLDSVVRTMYLVEGGAGAQLPENSDVLEHCRIMVLAFCGQADVLAELLGAASHTSAEPKVRHFWRGVAYHQAGDGERATEHYRRAQALLGPADGRAGETISARLAELSGDCTPVTLPDPEQTQRLVAAIRERVARTAARPRLQGRSWRRTPATVGLVLVNVCVFVAMELFGRGADDSATLIRAGASLSGAVAAGEYWRLASAMFLHANWLHLAVNVFMLWFLGRFFEQLVGGLRFFVVYFAAGVWGNLASHLWRSGPVSVGASSSIFGILGGALVVLLLSKGKVPESWRRSMVFVLALVIGLNFLPGLDVKVIDNFAHLGGLAGGALFAAALYRLRGSVGRLASLGTGLACVGVLAYCVWGLLTSAPEGLAWVEGRGGGLRVRHPATWFVPPGGATHKLELVDLVGRDQVVVVRAGPAAVTTLPALLSARWQELASGRKAVRRRLPPGTLPPGWVGFRRDVQRAGRRYSECRAFSLRGPPRARVEWQALLYTQGDFQRSARVFRRMLASLRRAP